ncbi:MAG: Stp1/IreP family PP2C-type Ser/Thr phosphatase [Eubacteriales bacterium]|nr:Stp1/IreP family PP2C-type Ser/Thr phosphatase [Eubacteriales bacterium]
MMHQVACITDKGRHRPGNEDFILCMESDYLFMVADGVGGHNSGELASRLAGEHIKEYIKANPIPDIADDLMLKDYFLNCFSEANQNIYKWASQVEKNAGMATTAVLAYIPKNKAYIVNVGDSRAYLVRDSQLYQITEDHTYVNDLLKKGTITKEEVINHPDRNMITRALGSEETVEPDFYLLDVQKGDRILLCTDGLYNEIEAEEIRHLAQTAINIELMAQELVGRANQYGGRDNISVICIEIKEREKEKDNE